MDRFGTVVSQYCISVGLLCILLYMYGFFPIKTSSKTFSSNMDFPANLKDIKLHKEQLYKSSVGKTILMIIDGLRVDFVTTENMPYTASLLANEGEQNACQYTTRVSAPTVTLPRIKAIVTGTVSSFIDVVLNIGAQELTLDSIIFQASQSKNVVFYGDDTWIKLFPKHFMRSEGTSSFFVNDYTEVDNNVTRHLEDELQSDDWDLMVLHYLGLDHIGHIEGPKSSLAPPKLREMDDIISKLHLHLSKEEGGILVVCGDHGMKDTGSHGGVSLPEVLVPFIVLGLSCPEHFKEEILQVDIAATLSVLWGAPIPADNIGVAAAGLLAHLAPTQRLYTWLYNGQQLMANFLHTGGDPQHESYLMYEEAKSLHHQWLRNNYTLSHQQVEALYMASLLGMSRFLSDVLANYDMFALISSIAVVTQVLCILGMVVIGMPQPSRGNICHALMLSGGIGGTVTVVTVFTKFPNWLSLLTSLIVFLLLFNSFLLYYQLRSALNFRKAFLLGQENLKSNKILIVGTLLFSISLFSSSLIEEEHQLWYFLWVTIGALNVIENPAPWLSVLVIHRFLRTLNQTGDKWAHLPDTSDWLTLPHNKLLLSAFSVISLGGVCWCCYKTASNCLCKLLCFPIVLCVYIHKITAVQIVPLTPELSYYLSINGVGEAQLCWLLLGLLVLAGRSLGSVLACCLLASCLLLRPYNTILPLSLFVISRFLIPSGHPSDTVYNSVLHHWLGAVFFFYQGNSNSLASVDIAAGYVGLEQYNVVLVGLLLLGHTYSMPILAYILNIYSMVDKAKQWKVSVSHSGQVVALLQLLHICVCLIVITLQRYHLFVWTVFSPKLLYVAAQTFVYFVLVTVTNLCIHIFN